MKKFLLSLTLLTAVLCSQAQQRDLWFNEIYPNPNVSTGTDEYIELYNTSSKSIQLDCYFVVSYFEIKGSGQSVQKGIYVYNFPSGATIDPRSHYVIGSDNPITHKGGVYPASGQTVNNLSNWNGTLTGGYINKYTLNGNNWSTGSTVTNLTDFMYIVNGNDASINLLLFRVNPDGTTTLVNSVFGNGNSSIPTAVTGLSVLNDVPIGSANCVTDPAKTLTSLSFSGITFKNSDVFNIQQNTGSDNGYARVGDGICGGWVKIEPQTSFTPGRRNPTNIGSYTAVMSTEESIVCGNGVKFRITSANSDYFPVTVEFYIDGGTKGVFDGDDILIPELTQTVQYSDLNKWLSVSTTVSNILIVYKTALGCFSKVIAPTVSKGSLTTTEKYICGNQVDFTVNTLNGLPTYVFPIEVEMYLDEDGNGQFDKDTTGAEVGDGFLIAEKTITSFSSVSQTLEIPDGYKNQKVIIVYNSASNCFDLKRQTQDLDITLTTTPKNFCGNKIEFTITGGSADAVAYAFPMKAQLFYDGDNDGEFDEVYGDPVDVLGTGPTVYSISIAPADADKVFKVQYSSNDFQCINEQKQTVTGALSFTTAQFGVCSNSTTSYTVNYNITGGSGDLASAYPFKAYLYADDGDGNFDADDELLQTSADINSVGGDEKYFFNVPGDKSVFVVYRNATGCFEKVSNLLESPTRSGCSVLPVIYQSFTAKRNNSSQVVLEWETATEVANKGFHIQRNLDGSWKDMGFVFSQANGGNSSTVLKYAFKDVNTSKGISQYRILQVDVNGKGRYSEIRSVSGEGALARMMVFPNPSTTGSVSLLFEDAASVRDITINDVSGRTIRQYKGISQNSLTIDNLQSGFYTVIVTNQTTGATTAEKIIIKKR